MPIITKIEQQKRNKHRFNIYLDKEFAFGVSEDVIVKEAGKLSVGREIDEHYIKTVIEAEEKQKVFNEAVNLLSYRPRSEKELRTRLRQKGYEDNWIDATIEKLRECNYVNDESFAKMYASDRMNIKKLGERAVQHELRQKGVSQEIIEGVLNEVFDNDRQLEQAVSLVEKKIRTLPAKDDFYKQKQKIFQFLARKGYSFDIIKRAIDQVFKIP